jgi:hypothetical protein
MMGTNIRDASSAIFYRMLRPEYLRYLKMTGRSSPLSADSLSMWGAAHGHQTEAHLHCQRVHQASLIMFNEVIPQFATQLASSRVAIDRVTLTRDMHARGINMRHLGFVLLCLPIDATQLRRLVLVEMVSRTLKNILRGRLRTRHEADGVKVSEFHSRQTIRDFLNIISSPYDSSSKLLWWRYDMPREIGCRLVCQTNLGGEFLSNCVDA